MKTYLRLLPYAQPVARYFVPYLLITLVATFFGIFNITLLMPLLDVMFGTAEVVASSSIEKNWSINDFKLMLRTEALEYIRKYGRESALITISIIF